MTPLSVSRSVPIANSEIVAGYEELRWQVLGSAGGTRGGWGLTLFLRQGMRGWIEGLAQYTSSSAVQLQKEVDPYTVIPLDIRGDVVKILAEMALFRPREARA